MFPNNQPPGAPAAPVAGQPGAPAPNVVVIQDSSGGYPRENMPVAPAANPAPVYSPVPGQPAAPVAPAPAAPAAPANTSIPVGPNTVLDGPGIPPELKGRTFGEMIGLYGSMRNAILSTAGNSPAPAPAAPAPAPAAPAAPVAPPVTATSAEYWRDPVGKTREALMPEIRTAIQEALAPMMAHQVTNQVDNVVAQMGTEFADFEAWRPAVQENLKGASAEMLANPELWRTAYWVAKGRAGAMGQPAPAAPAPAAPRPYAPPAPPAAPGTPYPAQPVVGAGQPQPNMGAGYFSEAPSAPNSAAGLAPSNEDAHWAGKLNMPVELYVQWKNGVPTPGGAR